MRIGSDYASKISSYYARQNDAGSPQRHVIADVNAGASDINLGSSSAPQRIQTALGIMQYTAGEEGGADKTDPRLINPQGKKGQFFAKLERFFKDRVAANLATPFGRSAGMIPQTPPLSIQ